MIIEGSKGDYWCLLVVSELQCGGLIPMPSQRNKPYQDLHDILDGNLVKSQYLVKGRLRGIYGDTSIPVIGIIG